MEQIVAVFMEYSDTVCITLSVATVIISGITLHRLKKLERGLYRTREKAEVVQPKEQKAVAEQVLGESREEVPVAADFSGEQEKLLDDVLGEVFP